MSSTQFFVRYVLLWFSGVALRITVLAVPPIVPRLHNDLHLSETGIGILSSLPPLLFAAAAVPGSLLIARLGAVPTLVAGLLITAVAGAARGALADTVVLFLTSAVMAFGIAVMQPALPQLVRSWMPERIGFATALYTNGLLIGETASVALTIPYVLPMVGDSWRWSFVVWSVPVLLTAVLAASILPRPPQAAAAPAIPPRTTWWPDWGSWRIWKLGLLLGSVNSVYFATNAFLPDYLTETGQADSISAALTAINLAQLPASFVMLAFTGRFARRPAAFVTTGVLTLIGLAGAVTMSGVWVVVWTSLVGLASAVTLILAFALPSLLSAPHDVHRTSAAMITIGYSCAMATPVIGGFLWDITGQPLAAFVPILIWPVLTALLPLVIDFHKST